MLFALGASTISGADRFVSLTGGHVAPFTDWASAATNIQAAIDVADAGDVVWVTNGIYNTGGKVMAGDLTNRVAVNKRLLLQSVNGPQVTTITGQWPAVTPEDSPGVCCVWMVRDSGLGGFPLTGGAGGSLVRLATGGTGELRHHKLQ